MKQSRDNDEPDEYFKLDHDDQGNRFHMIKIPGPIIPAGLAFVSIFRKPLPGHHIIEFIEV